MNSLPAASPPGCGESVHSLISTVNVPSVIRTTMNKKICFMIFCLLMTTPYIIGGESAVREGEIPNAHSMVRKTVRRKVALSQKERDNLSQRKKSLILEGDLQFMPKVTVGLHKDFQSSLPVKITSFCNSASKLAYFVRKTIVASGLSKKQARTVIKLIFPSRSAIRREARREGLSKRAVRNDYLARQQTLHKYLSSLVHLEWASTFDDLQNSHRKMAIELREKLDEKGGYISIADTEEAYLEERHNIQETYNKIRRDNTKVLTTFKEWGADKKQPFVTEACFKKFPKLAGKVEIGTDKSLVIKAARLNRDSRKKELDEQQKLELETLEESHQELKSRHDELPVTKLYKEMRAMERRVEYFSEHAHLLSLTFDSEEPAPWMDFGLSWKMAKEDYVLVQLEEAEQGNDIAFIHHPSLLWNHCLTAEDLVTVMASKLNPDDNTTGVKIQRANKPKFEGSWKEHGINNIRQLSEHFGLATRIENEQEFKQIPAKKLWEQYHESSITLNTPTGVLAQLGAEFNDYFDEGGFYRSKWAGETYQFNTPTRVKLEKQQTTKKRKALMSRFNFGN